MTDIAVRETSCGFRVALINHNPGDVEITFDPVITGSAPEWTDLVSQQRLTTNRPALTTSVVIARR